MGSYSLQEVWAIARELGACCLLSRAFYPLRQRFYEARCMSPDAGIQSQRRHAPAADLPLGRLLNHRLDGQTVDLLCTNGVLRLEFLASDPSIWKSKTKG
jgi:hypothetical protein